MKPKLEAVDVCSVEVWEPVAQLRMRSELLVVNVKVGLTNGANDGGLPIPAITTPNYTPVATAEVSETQIELEV